MATFKTPRMGRAKGFTREGVIKGAKVLGGENIKDVARRGMRNRFRVHHKVRQSPAADSLYGTIAYELAEKLLQCGERESKNGKIRGQDVINGARRDPALTSLFGSMLDAAPLPDPRVAEIAMKNAEAHALRVAQAKEIQKKKAEDARSLKKATAEIEKNEHRERRVKERELAKLQRRLEKLESKKKSKGK